MEDLKNNVKQYIVIKGQLELLNTRQTEIKDRLMDALEQHGETDGKGHKILDLGEDLMGVTQLIRQRKTTKTFDMDTATSLLHEKGIYEKCIIMKPSLNEDAIMAAFYDGVLTEEEIDTMFPSKVSYAFLAKK